jgi:general L-amino acid transport system substrate-binding protein
MFKRLILMALLLVSVGAVALVSAQDEFQVELGPITQAIFDRGEVICGANAAGLAGFATVNDAGEWEGFDVDVCRAIAAAILGDANAISFRPLEAGERQAALQSGEIDVMSRNTTFTLSRDVTWASTFAPTTFYDGQGIMVKTESGIATIDELNGARVCVQSGTTTELNLADAMSVRALDYEPVVFAEAAATWEAYLSGACDAFTTDKSGLVAYKGSSEDPGAHVILEETLSKEPLGPVSPQSDEQFADIVRWTVNGLIQAEEYGISSTNVQDFVSSEIPEIQRFLGQGDNAIGTLLGIPNDFMVTVITQVGNYGEIYERHLGPETPFDLPRGLNNLWTNGGLLYSPPFR